MVPSSLHPSSDVPSSDPVGSSLDNKSRLKLGPKSPSTCGTGVGLGGSRRFGCLFIQRQLTLRPRINRAVSAEQAACGNHISILELQATAIEKNVSWRNKTKNNERSSPKRKSLSVRRRATEPA